MMRAEPACISGHSGAQPWASTKGRQLGESVFPTPLPKASPEKFLNTDHY